MRKMLSNICFKRKKGREGKGGRRKIGREAKSGTDR
jgi:hypothetical protein